MSGDICVRDVILIQSKENQSAGLTCEVLSVCDDRLHIIVRPVDYDKWFPQMNFITDFSFKVDISKSYITNIYQKV